LDGTLQSPTRIEGTMGVKISGIEHENPTPSGATKFSLAEGQPDSARKGGVLRGVLQQLAAGSLALPHDDAAIAMNGGRLPADLSALGAIQLIAYLGPSFREVPSVTRGVPNVDPNFVSTYLVEFDK